MLSRDKMKTFCSSHNLVFAALVGVEALCLYTWVVAPHGKHLRSAKQYAAVTDKLATKSLIVGSNVKVRKKKFEQLQEQFEDIHAKLFDPVKAKEFLSDIQAMAAQTNCVIHSLNFNPSDSSANKNNSRISTHIAANRTVLSVGGDYKDILALVDKLQTGSRQVWINSINIEPLSRNSELLKCDMAITIYIINTEQRSAHG